MADKTNAMRKLDSMKIAYKEYFYTNAVSGIEVATELGENPKQVFKTLVTVAKSGAHYVFLIPVAEELDLKKAAAVVGEKAVDMLKSKDGDFFVSDWLRNRNTIEFLGIWEEIHN